MSGLARSYGIALEGLAGVPIEVQTHIGPGLVGTTLVGLPDASLREAKERVRAALFSCGIGAVNERVTVNLTPADLPKAGSGFDLAIAVSMLIARRILPEVAGIDTVYMAELGLDGSLLPVTGVLPVSAAAVANGFGRIVVAPENEAEARLLEELEVVGCAHLDELLAAFSPGADGQRESRGEGTIPWENLKALGAHRAQDSGSETSLASEARLDRNSEEPDLADVRGQEDAVLALTMAAVGGHHLLFHGPPGAGKTMLARRLPGILPDLSPSDALVATALRSVGSALGGVIRGEIASTLGERPSSLVRRPPLEAPHHSATMISLIGGGNPIRPGAVSLAHAGVLLLDEAPEFSQRTLDALRQPIEQSQVTVHRAKAQVTFPARFQLVMTANPCPCGGALSGEAEACHCSPHRIGLYRSRLSGPLLDRVDLQVHVDRPQHLDLIQSAPTDTETVAGMVALARERSAYRLRETPWNINGEVPGRFIRQSEQLSSSYTRELERLVERGILSLRGADRVLRMAWSSSDFFGRAKPNTDDFSLAMKLRGMAEGVPSWI
ncbi:MAG: ATP-binding protein [Scrofimicrobium sp.]